MLRTTPPHGKPATQFLMVFVVMAILYFVFGKTLSDQVSKIQKPKTITGTAYVIDGDTIIIDDSKIRLAKIDACELGQPAQVGAKEIDCGLWAKNQLLAIIAQQSVTCFVTGTDRYQRIIAHCSTSNDETRNGDIGIKMLENGSAEIYPKFKNNAKAKAAYQKARFKNLGIHSFDDYRSPAHWRRSN